MLKQMSQQLTYALYHKGKQGWFVGKLIIYKLIIIPKLATSVHLISVLIVP